MWSTHHQGVPLWSSGSQTGLGWQSGSFLTTACPQTSHWTDWNLSGTAVEPTEASYPLWGLQETLLLQWQEAYYRKPPPRRVCSYTLGFRGINIFLFSQTKCKPRIPWIHNFIVRHCQIKKIQLFFLSSLVAACDFSVTTFPLWLSWNHCNFLIRKYSPSLPKASIFHYLGIAVYGSNHGGCHANCPFKFPTQTLMGRTKHPRKQSKTRRSFCGVFCF